jgi:mannose-6-phosphate isomerase-like protein (cupin superfamily)
MRAASLAGNVLAGPSLVLAEWRDPGGETDPPRYIAPLHIHHSDDEAWYVLQGALRFRLDDEEVEAQAGGAVIAVRGVAHTYWNPRPDPARYVLVMTTRSPRSSTRCTPPARRARWTRSSATTTAR